MNLTLPYSYTLSWMTRRSFICILKYEVFDYQDKIPKMMWYLDQIPLNSPAFKHIYILPVPSRRLRPFLPDRKLPQEQEFVVIGAREPRVFLRQWSNGPRHSQEFSFSTQLDCKLLEYRNLTHLQLLQPCLLQVQLSYSYCFEFSLNNESGSSSCEKM